MNPSDISAYNVNSIRYSEISDLVEVGTSSSISSFGLHAPGLTDLIERIVLHWQIEATERKHHIDEIKRRIGDS